MAKFTLVHYQAHVNGPVACGDKSRGIMTDQTHKTTCHACVTSREFQDLVFATPEAKIGYLCNSTQVLCDACAADANVVVADDLRVVRLYRENIGRYGQHCHGCGRELVAAAPGWCELFDRVVVAGKPDIDCGPILTADEAENAYGAADMADADIPEGY